MHGQCLWLLTRGEGVCPELEWLHGFTSVQIDVFCDACSHCRRAPAPPGLLGRVQVEMTGLSCAAPPGTRTTPHEDAAQGAAAVPILLSWARQVIGDSWKRNTVV